MARHKYIRDLGRVRSNGNTLILVYPVTEIRSVYVLAVTELSFLRDVFIGRILVQRGYPLWAAPFVGHRDRMPRALRQGLAALTGRGLLAGS